MRRIVGKAISWCLRDDIQEAAGPLQVAVGYMGKNLRFLRSIFFLDHFYVNFTNPKKFFKKSHFWRFAGQKSILDPPNPENWIFSRLMKQILNLPFPNDLQLLLVAKYPKNRLKGTLLSHLQSIRNIFRADIGQIWPKIAKKWVKIAENLIFGTSNALCPPQLDVDGYRYL